MPNVCSALSRPQILRETRHLEVRHKKEAYLRGNAALVAAEQDLAQAVRPHCSSSAYTTRVHWAQPSHGQQQGDTEQLIWGN